MSSPVAHLLRCAISSSILSQRSHCLAMPWYPWPPTTISKSPLSGSSFHNRMLPKLGNWNPENCKLLQSLQYFPCSQDVREDNFSEPQYTAQTSSLLCWQVQISEHTENCFYQDFLNSGHPHIEKCWVFSLLSTPKPAKLLILKIYAPLCELIDAINHGEHIPQLKSKH